MNVIERSTTPDGISIQLENWNGSLHIGAYPIAKNTTKCRGTQAGKEFRLTIAENKYKNYNNSNVRADYEALKSGVKSLHDLSEYFWNGKKDMWLLGMDVDYKEE